MSYPVVRISTNVVDRLLTADLWRHSLDNFADNTPNHGVKYFNDFTQRYSNGTDATQVGEFHIQDMAAGGTSESLLSTNAATGKLNLSAATGTAHFGIEAVRNLLGVTPGHIHTPASDIDPKGRLVYEVAVTVDASELLYVGLTEDGAEFLSATSALPTGEEYIGFYKAAGGAIRFVAESTLAGGSIADVEIVAAADVVDGDYKFGFAVNPDLSVDIVVNHVVYRAKAGTVAASAIPGDEPLVDRYCAGRGAGADTTVSLLIDWVALYIGA